MMDNALLLDYDLFNSKSYAGYVSPLPIFDLREFQLLRFLVKVAGDGQDCHIGLRDSLGHESKVRLSHYLPDRNIKQWQLVEIPLAAFTEVEDWGPH